jgi:hypothetical protein
MMSGKKRETKSMLTGKERKKYTVWVGGTEVTMHFITYSHAKRLLESYTNDGYTDVIIQNGR